MPKKKGGKDKGPDPNNPFDMVLAQPEQVLELVATRDKLAASVAAEKELKEMNRQLKDQLGQQKFEQDEKKGRYLVFKDSGPGDIMLFFDPEKTETSEWVLKKKYEGRKVRATGTVVLSAKRLLLDIASIDDLRLHTDEPVPPAAN